ncbi:hypothetical protein PHYPSEUDO_006718 [Phytophthora pseudosyringae]|uniref:Ankyrin repeat protein n=1 Tax=Phytophthora pseudosyringae TaxID=221518 RepID=A0A8T1VHT8_9STRA|nr:hypothetical protein PHYPSEUDO_006718 [Phytophthora pseudosyringae]
MTHKKRRSRASPLPPFPRLEDVPLPDVIRALPHVLRLIDMLLMSPKEAATEAARTGQSDWLDECDVKDALLGAAASGHLDILIHYYIEPSDEEQMKEMAAVIQRAARRAADGGHLDVIQFLLLERVDWVQNNVESTCMGWRDVDALAYAIFYGYSDLVEFLFSVFADYHWALSMAIDTSQPALPDPYRARACCGVVAGGTHKCVPSVNTAM